MLIYNFLHKLEHNASCDLPVTSDCGYKLTFDPSPYTSMSHRRPHKGASRGGRKSAAGPDPSSPSFVTWPHPRPHGRANQETMQEAKREDGQKKEKKIPQLTFSPFAGWPLTLVLSPRPGSRGQPEVRLRGTCWESVRVGAEVLNRKWKVLLQSQ